MALIPATHQPTTPEGLALVAALEAGDVSVLPILADAVEDAGGEWRDQFACTLRAIASDDRPGARAWRALVECGEPCGPYQCRRMTLAHHDGSMVRVEAYFFARSGGHGLQPTLSIRTADESWSWSAGPGGWWFIPPGCPRSAIDGMERLLARTGRLFRRASGRLDYRPE